MIFDGSNTNPQHGRNLLVTESSRNAASNSLFSCRQFVIFKIGVAHGALMLRSRGCRSIGCVHRQHQLSALAFESKCVADLNVDQCAVLLKCRLVAEFMPGLICETFSKSVGTS